MTKIAHYLECKGMVLRSGGACGADMAFEAGISDPANKEIHLPWRGFNLNKSKLYGVSEDAMRMAASFHPVWDELSTGAKELHARNCYQVLGRDLSTPSKFLVCWTRGGRMVGGTAQTLRIANHYEIPVLNLARDKDLSIIHTCMMTDQIFAPI